MTQYRVLDLPPVVVFREQLAGGVTLTTRLRMGHRQRADVIPGRGVTVQTEDGDVVGCVSCVSTELWSGVYDVTITTAAPYRPLDAAGPRGAEELRARVQQLRDSPDPRLP